MKKTYLFVSILVAGVMLLSACRPAATTAPTATQPPSTVPSTATKPHTAVPPKPTHTPTPTPTPVPPPVCNALPDAMTAPATGQLGAPDKPITIAFVSSATPDTITNAGSAMADCLNKMTGLTYTVQTGTSYAAVIEAMGAGTTQVGFLNIFSILVGQAKYGIIPALVNLHQYSTNDLDPDKALAHKWEPFSRVQFIASVASGIKTFADLKGKTFCFVHPYTIAGYTVPRIVLQANGINPDTDFKATKLVDSNSQVAISVYKGDCDAGLTNINVLTSATANLGGKYPDILQKVSVFADSDRIPYDGVQYIKTLDPKLQAITTEAILAMVKDQGGNAILAELYPISAFKKIDSTFTMYSDFSAFLKKAGVDPATLIK